MRKELETRLRMCIIVVANHFIIIVVLARCNCSIENPTRRDHKLNELMIIGCSNDTNAGEESLLFRLCFACCMEIWIDSLKVALCEHIQLKFSVGIHCVWRKRNRLFA